jgi:hypothetical protein
MINLIISSKHYAFAASLVSLLLLQGCGGDRRDTPFDPAGTSSSSSSVSSVTITELGSGDARVKYTAFDNTEKRLQVVRDLTTFNSLSDHYSESPISLLANKDFTNGQVVVIYTGETDSCKNRVLFNKISAQKEGVNSVRVVVTYVEKSAVTNCVSSTATLSWLYYFYYVESTGPLIFEEKTL